MPLRRLLSWVRGLAFRSLGLELRGWDSGFRVDGLSGAPMTYSCLIGNGGWNPTVVQGYSAGYIG